MGTSVALALAGMSDNYRRNVRRLQSNQHRGSYTSPLLIAGCAGVLFSISFVFTIGGHIEKAINVYNR
jgi:hypothetical protein